MNESHFDIEKAAAVIVQDRQAVLTRSEGKDVFVPPGGKLESKSDGERETQIESLIRELDEELGIAVTEDDLEFIDNYYAEAAGGSGKSLKMGVWIVKNFSGEMKPQNEVAEIKTVGSQIPEGVEVGSIFLHDVIPELVKRDLID